MLARTASSAQEGFSCDFVVGFGQGGSLFTLMPTRVFSRRPRGARALESHRRNGFAALTAFRRERDAGAPPPAPPRTGRSLATRRGFAPTADPRVGHSAALRPHALQALHKCGRCSPHRRLLSLLAPCFARR